MAPLSLEIGGRLKAAREGLEARSPGLPDQVVAPVELSQLESLEEFLQVFAPCFVAWRERK
jgi:hypothetical protein